MKNGRFWQIRDEISRIRTSTQKTKLFLDYLDPSLSKWTVIGVFRSLSAKLDRVLLVSSLIGQNGTFLYQEPSKWTVYRLILTLICHDGPFFYDFGPLLPIWDLEKKCHVAKTNLEKKNSISQKWSLIREFFMNFGNFSVKIFDHYCLSRFCPRTSRTARHLSLPDQVRCHIMWRTWPGRPKFSFSQSFKDLNGSSTKCSI